MEQELYKRYHDETNLDYLVRLFENKEEYHLTCSKIADLINADTGKNYGESAYRKFYSAFNAGRTYERSFLKKEDNSIKTICISDLHYPFALPLDIFRDYAYNVTYLVLNGDLLDMQSISKFPKKYRISPMEEIIGCRQYLIDLIEMISPKYVIVNKGNHEDRFGTYLSKTVDCELKELLPDTPLELMFVDGFHHYDKKSHSKIFYSPIKDIFSDIEIIYTNRWWCQINSTIYAHPSAYSAGMLKTADKALSFFLRHAHDKFDSIILAHTHKIGMYKDMITIYEQGTCSDISKLQYADGKLQTPQQMGFALVYHHSDGTLNFDKTRIVAV